MEWRKCEPTATDVTMTKKIRLWCRRRGQKNRGGLGERGVEGREGGGHGEQGIKDPVEDDEE